MSKREVFLVFVLALIVPVALIVVLLILPLQQEIEANQTRLQTLELQKLETENKLTLIPTYRARKEERAEQIDDAFDEFASPLHAAEFERWMLPVFNKYGVFVSNATLSETIVAQPDLMITPITEPSYRILELIQTYNEIEEVVESARPQATTQLLSATYTYSFNANLQTYMAILDEVKNWNTTFVVTSSSFNPSDLSATISVRAYSVHKLTEDEVLGIYLGDYGLHPNETTNPNTDLPDIPK